MVSDEEYRRKQEEDLAHKRQYARMNNLENVPGTNETNPSYQRPSNTSSNGCFPSGTLISTPLGAKDIADIQKGDVVTSYCTKRRIIQSSLVLATKIHGKNEIWHIVFQGNMVLRTTAVHSFFDGKKWIRAHNLANGDMISYFDAVTRIHKNLTVVSAYKSNEVESVYNIIVSEDFCFFANGTVASSFSYFRTFRIHLWSLDRLVRRWLSFIDSIIPGKSLSIFRLSQL